MEFSNFTITARGQALMAKLMQGTGTCDFSAIKLSSHVYTESQLYNLTSLSDVKQTCGITKKTVLNTTSIEIQGAVDNIQLTVGYTINTIGIYAVDPDVGEILYAVAIASVAGYMPPYNNKTVSGGVFKFVITVGNAAQVTVTVDPAGYATIADVQQLEAEITDIKGYIGLDDDSVFGVEVDFANRTFTRLAGAVGRTPGTGFDGLEAWGGRYRCNLTDAGVEVAKYGDAGYTETGALTQAITIGEDESAVTYPVGTAVQVMVKQPKFYYRVVPLKMDKIADGHGYHLRKARYYISMSPKKGFKIHPAFVHESVEKDFIYLSAYEGTLYDVSASAYILDDSQVADFTASTGDKLSSIANAKPASGLTQNLTRANCGVLAKNRGTGWLQSFAASAAATQLLFLIEYASFNTQTKIGNGNSGKTDDGASNMAEITGATANLGNASGAVTNTNNINIVTYRGEENFWANIFKFVDGLNIYCDPTIGEHYLYVCNDLDFTESKKTGNYKDCGFTLAKANGYVNAFGYSEEFDWLFFPSETGNSASSSVPVGDYFYQAAATAGYKMARLGGRWANGADAGGFYWYVNAAPSNRYRDVGGRLAYVPGLTPAA